MDNSHKRALRIMMRGVRKTYRGASHPVLKNLDLEVKKGEVCVILGENGAGKTTLLNTLCGILRQDDGRIEIDGIEDPVRRRANLGMVPQHNNLDRRMSIRDNLFYNAILYDRDKGAIDRRIYEISEDFGLSRYLKNQPASISGGTARKVVLARAFISAKSVLILDEPTNHLDQSFRDHLFKKINQFCTKGGSVLLSTHNFDDIERVSNPTVVRLIDGRVLIADPVKFNGAKA